MQFSLFTRLLVYSSPRLLVYWQPVEDMQNLKFIILGQSAFARLLI